jgi:hypothetical protein
MTGRGGLEWQAKQPNENRTLRINARNEPFYVILGSE